MKSQTSNLLFFILLLGSTSYLNAQEFLVTVNPATGVHSKTLAIASTKSIQVNPGHTTFDKVHNRYFYRGLDWSGAEKFYIINANTSATNHEVVFPGSNSAFNKIGNLQYDDSTGNIYCTGLHLASNTVFLLKMDTVTAAVSTVVAIPNIGNAESNQCTYDQNKHRYLFIGQDPMSTGGTRRYLNINVLNGSVVANVPNIGFLPNSLRLNSVTNKLYAFVPPIPTSSLFNLLVEFDPITATRIATVASNPSMGTISYVLWQPIVAPNHTSIDEINNRYTISMSLGPDNNGVNSYSLFTVSLATGSLLTKPFFPQGLNMAGENVVELHYNNNNGLLYGLHWKYTNNPVGIHENKASDLFEVFPNPSTGLVTLDLNEDYKTAEVSIFQGSSQLQESYLFRDGEKIQLDLSDKSEGVYFLHIKIDNKVSVQKVVKIESAK